MRKPAFCKCKNKGADQLCGNRAADLLLCFHYIDSTIHVLPNSCFLNEPRHDKTNILVSDLVRHKSGCTATEDG